MFQLRGRKKKKNSAINLNHKPVLSQIYAPSVVQKKLQADCILIYRGLPRRMSEANTSLLGRIIIHSRSDVMKLAHLDFEDAQCEKKKNVCLVCALAFSRN